MELNKTPERWQLDLTDDELHFLMRALHSAHIRWSDQEKDGHTTSLDRPRAEELGKLISDHPDYRPE